MAVVAEGARARTALAARFSVSSSSVIVSFKRPGRCAGTAEFAAALAAVPAERPILFVVAGTIFGPVAVKSAACVSASVVVVSVIKRMARRVIPIAIVKYDSVIPIGSPMMPAPAITSVKADSGADSVRRVQAAIPDSWILVPSRPLRDGTSVNYPPIIFGDVNYLGTSRLNDDGRVLGRYGLLLRSLKTTCFLV